ncbi:MAG: hypothetical protein AVO33_01040 [delta proteobacterium ML8_F1]|jgi:ribonuclease R|nr:MAG: hypothetical protein AVO33_01040 [delta proteobacterium ML8_F1]
MARKKRTPALDAQSLIQAFRKARKPLRYGDLTRLFKLGSQRREELDAVLNTLVHEGKIIQMRDSYGLVENMPTIVGNLKIQRSGVGFVLPEDNRRRDVFISPRDMNAARHGDRVEAVVMSRRHGRNPEGRILRILERQTQIFAVRILQPRGKGLWLGQVTDPKLELGMEVHAADPDMQPQRDDIILARIGEQLEAQLWSGTMTALLGPETDLDVQEQVVKFNHQVPTDFPRPALEQAEALPAMPREEDFQGRRDLRDLPLVTIDGETARDFDDAICVQQVGQEFRLWVAVADVAHYVQPGTPLDEEAKERGNSYYFPKSVEPMFPRRLSNGLCSLNPDQPRLVMVAEMDFDAQGTMVRSDFYNAVMQSHARLTYEQVDQALPRQVHVRVQDHAQPRTQAQIQAPNVVTGQENTAMRQELGPLTAMLDRAAVLAATLKQQRHARGSLDFDLPDPEILLNIQGQAADIQARERLFSHQLIEEFMIAANEAVAAHLTSKRMTLLYRVHDQPDPEKLRSLFKILERCELDVRVPRKMETADPSMLQELLAAARDTDMEFLVNRQLLRSQMQAKYSPENIGHFGLASTCYTHFTSPIRRYADLEVHRALKTALLGQGPKMSSKKLTSLGDHLSRQERRAMAAEREMLKRVTIMFLLDRVGEEFSGVIASLADFGFWVELTDLHADGLVRLSSLSDDYYAFFPERQELVGRQRGRVFRMGQKVWVVLTNVSLSRLEINLALKDQGTGKGTSTRKTRQPGHASRT